MFTPIWGRFPFWLTFFRGVETTNYVYIYIFIYIYILIYIQSCEFQIDSTITSIISPNDPQVADFCGTQRRRRFHHWVHRICFHDISRCLILKTQGEKNDSPKFGRWYSNPCFFFECAIWLESPSSTQNLLVEMVQTFVLLAAAVVYLWTIGGGVRYLLLGLHCYG